MVEAPDSYFSWILEVYNLVSAGFTIENRQLSLAEWKDLATMKSLLEAKREHESLTSVSHEMLTVLVEAQRRKR